MSAEMEQKDSLLRLSVLLVQDQIEVLKKYDEGKKKEYIRSKRGSPEEKERSGTRGKGRERRKEERAEERGESGERRENEAECKEEDLLSECTPECL